MASLYLNYIGMESWPRRKKTKVANYCVWRFVELFLGLFNVPVSLLVLACILPAPVLKNELDVSWGIEFIFFSIKYRICLQSFRSVCFKILETIIEIIKYSCQNVQRYFFLKAKQIMDP